MHQAAFEWVARHAPRTAAVVVEVGSRDVNGSVRPIFGFCDRYIGVDITDGPAVDVVADFATWDFSGADCVVCCEVLEHVEDWRDIVTKAAEVVNVGGTVILTAACDPRAPHSAVDGAGLRPGEFYENVDPEQLPAVLDELFSDVTVDGTPDGDVRAVARGKR